MISFLIFYDDKGKDVLGDLQILGTYYPIFGGRRRKFKILIFSVNTEEKYTYICIGYSALHTRNPT